MKLTVNRDQIIGGLQKAASIIPLKAASISLRSIWIKAENDQISIMATDADLEFAGIYPAKVEKPGLIGVHGRALADLIAKWPSGEINIELDESSQTLHLTQKRRSYNLPVSLSEWFQSFEEWNFENNIIWSGDLFSEILEKVSYCISDEDNQDAMSNMFLQPLDNGKINACGLNGHQFAMQSFINDDLANLFSSDGLMIQKKFLADIKKWLTPGEIELNMDEKRLFLSQLGGAETLSVPKYNKNAYPDYNLFLSKLEGEGEGDLIISRLALFDVLSRFMVFVTESNRCVFIDLKSDEIDLTAQGTDNGSGRESIEAVYTGKLSRIAFPIKELKEIIEHFESEKITMHFTAQEGPCGITGEQDANYIVVIMPMRVSDNIS